MSDYETLIQLDKSRESFIDEMLEFNLSKYRLSSKEETPVMEFYNHLRDVQDFERRIFETSTTIFKRRFSYDKQIQNRFYAVDETGLSIGYIIGPSDPDDFTVAKKHYDYYGAYGEKCINSYDCVALMSTNNSPASIFVSLEDFRSNFLPLPRLIKDSLQQFYFESSYDGGNLFYQLHYGKYIYRSNQRSVFIPYPQLIRREIGQSGGTIQVDPFYEDEFISFEASSSYHGRKYDYWTTYKGKISYETFEVSEFAITEEDRERND